MPLPLANANDKLRIYYTTSVTTCDCCGKANLKHTVAISCEEQSVIVHLGTVCAGRYMGYRMTGNPWRALARLADRARSLGLSLGDIMDAMEEHAHSCARTARLRAWRGRSPTALGLRHHSYGYK